MLIALQDLRTDHINILRLLASQRPDSDKAGSRGWYPFAIPERSGMDRDLTYLCIAGLREFWKALIYNTSSSIADAHLLLNAKS
ncbi:hypothetical protein ACQHIV_35260 [Kribbella sp. GL6]|uniref:hypothetical protein n=1 Tax=Kribbella sp. GL6 TaxID=3419765 RepID=UPI003CFEBF55